jgi:prepilin-type N-terminal cleavage/methylation domain-containing protein
LNIDNFMSKKSQKGFSLIEAIVALGVFAMLAATVSSTAGLGYLSEKQSGERIIAQAYVTEAIEATKSIRRRGWPEVVSGEHGLQKNSGFWEFNGIEGVLGDYMRKTTISDVFRDENGDIVSEESGSLDQHSKLVNIVVTWELSPGVNNELKVNNYLTNWQSHDWTQTDWSNGDSQESWLDEGSFWTASDSIDISTIGEVKLSAVGTIPSPYALLMHMDGPRYIDSDSIDNSSFEDYSGVSPEVSWSNWSEISFASSLDSIDGVDGKAAEISYDWWIGLGGLEQTSIPVEGDTTYQLSFYLKGDVSYSYFVIQDEDNYYLRPDGSFSWWHSTNYVPITSEWTQYNLSFTTRSNASSLKLSLSGFAMNWGQSFAFDEVSLSREVVYDDGPYGNHGYKIPDDDDGPDYVSGNFSDALDFDGAGGEFSGDAVQIPSSDSLDIASTITLEAWIKPDNIGNDYRSIVNKWTWATGDFRSYGLAINPNDKLEFFISSDGQDGNGHEYSLLSAGKIDEDEWQHVVGVYDGSEMRVYINGEPDGSMNYNGGIFQSGNNSDVFIGSIDKNLHNDFRFDGQIDEVSIENIALSDTEVYQHYISSPLTSESVIVWTSPTPVGTFMVDKKVAGMHIAGNYLYLALLDKKNVEVFDLSINPENPTSLGTFGTTNKSEDIFTFGNYIYVMTSVASPGIEVYYFDTNPQDAYWMSDIVLNDIPSGIWIDEDIMYVSLADDEVQVLDLSTSATIPSDLGDFSTIQDATDISIFGDYAYVSLDDDVQALQVFDISLDPANPSSTSISGAIETPVAITAREDYLFLMAGGSSRKVLVYNIGDNPSQPSALGDIDIIDNGWDVVVRGSYIYVGLGGSSKGVQVFDMTFMLAGGSGQSNFEVYGTVESSAFDVGSASGFNFVSWIETLPSAEENIRVQVKTSSTLIGLDSAFWFGSSGVGSYFESGSENIIPATNTHNGDQYMKYIIHLYGSGDDTPILSNININYTP